MVLFISSIQIVIYLVWGEINSRLFYDNQRLSRMARRMALLGSLGRVRRLGESGIVGPLGNTSQRQHNRPGSQTQ